MRWSASTASSKRVWPKLLCAGHSRASCHEKRRWRTSSTRFNLCLPTELSTQQPTPPPKDCVTATEAQSRNKGKLPMLTHASCFSQLLYVQTLHSAPSSVPIHIRYRNFSARTTAPVERHARRTFYTPINLAKTQSRGVVERNVVLAELLTCPASAFTHQSNSHHAPGHPHATHPPSPLHLSSRPTTVTASSN